MPGDRTALERLRERHEARRPLLAHGDDVRRAIGRLRDPALVEAVEGDVSTKLVDRAAALKLVDPFTGALDPRHIEEVERTLGKRFVREVRRQVQGTARQAHLQGDVTERSTPPFKPEHFPRNDGRYLGHSCGFHTDTVLGAAPESLIACLWTRWRRQLSALHAHSDGDRNVKVNVLHIGAGRGALATMIDADASVEFDTYVTEVEAWRGGRNVVSTRSRSLQMERRTRNAAILAEQLHGGIEVHLEDFAAATGAPAYSSLVARLFEAPIGKNQFHFALYQFPTPSCGAAAQLRNIYKSSDEALVPGTNYWVPQAERRVFDLGRLAPKKWLRAVIREIQRIPNLMKPGGEVALLGPGAVCEFPEKGTTNEMGATYRPLPALFENIAEELQKTGLSILRVFDVEERAPARQPFVGRRRSPQRLWIANVPS